MSELNRLWYLFTESLRVFAEKFRDTIPNLLGGIIVLLIVLLLARLISGGLERLLRTISFDKFAERIHFTRFLQQANITVSPSFIIGRFIYWVFILLIISSAAETLNWTPVSFQIQRFLEYLPHFVTAVIILIIGWYFATAIRDFLRRSMGSLGISAGRVLSTAIYYLLIIMISLTALEQAHVDTRILSTNLLIIISAVMLAAAISYGYAARDVLSNILAGFFNKRTFQKGMTIEVEDVRGVIVEITNISVTLQINDTERVVIPSQTLLNNKVKIIN